MDEDDEVILAVASDVGDLSFARLGEISAATTEGALLEDLPAVGRDQLVVGVRLMYRPWEDTKDLPGQIVMRADRQGGNIRTELQ